MTELPTIARVGVAQIWHACPSPSAPAVAHLMPTQWAADGRKTRPALCGERRMRWSSAAAVDRQLTPCDACLTAAEGRQQIGAQVRIAPSARRAESLPGRIVDPMQPNSAGDRLGRRLAFRDELVVLSESAERYLDEQLLALQDRHRRTVSAPAVVAVPDVVEDQADDLDRDEHAPLLAYTSG